MNKNKEEYQSFIDLQENVPVFFQTWWLDTVSGNNSWDAIIIKNRDEKTIGALPFLIKKIMGFPYASQPNLTPFLGALYKYPDKLDKAHSKIEFENKVNLAIAKQIKKRIPYFSQYFDPQIVNTQAFGWEGFKQLVCHRFYLDQISNIDMVYKNFKGDLRTQIRKFEPIGTIIEANDVIDLYPLIQNSFEKNHAKIPYLFEQYDKLDKLINNNSRRRIFLAKLNGEENYCGGLYLLIDKNRAFMLSTGLKPAYRKYGVMAALIWTAIKEAAQFVQIFDFAGSMVPSIARYLISFSPKQEVSFRIYHSRYKFLETLQIFQRKL